MAIASEARRREDVSPQGQDLAGTRGLGSRQPSPRAGLNVRIAASGDFCRRGYYYIWILLALENDFLLLTTKLKAPSVRHRDANNGFIESVFRASLFRL